MLEITNTLLIFRIKLYTSLNVKFALIKSFFIDNIKKKCHKHGFVFFKNVRFLQNLKYFIHYTLHFNDVFSYN